MDHILFIKIVGTKYVAVLVYVDDIIIASNNDEDVNFVKETLAAHFSLHDLGPLRYLLGLIVRSSMACRLNRGSIVWNYLRKLEFLHLG